LGLLAAISLLVTPAAGVWGDCGSIPFYAPVILDLEFSDLRVLADTNQRTSDISFDPLQVTVFEPYQRAIILWNGTEETLLLSTDQHASEKTAVLEVIPLPSEPKVRLGSFDTFEKAQRLVVEKRMWAVAHGGVKAGLVAVPASAGRIAFHEKMGAHDVTVAEAIDKSRFVDFVQGHLRQQYGVSEAPIRPEFVEIIQSYLADGYRWFAFDVIALGDANKSREPIEYRFKSDRVFYPMRISNMERGETQVELLVFTGADVSEFEGLSEGLIARERPVDVRRDEVESLDEKWRGFFGGASDLVMNQWMIEGDIRTFDRDVLVR
jgi:hypothetical protein